MTGSVAPWGPRPASAPAGAAALPAPDRTPSRPRYDGRLGELYALYLRHVVLMVLTLGWSRFWGRTRLRRYLWNHLSVLGDRLEYRGRGLELMIGFVIVLALLGLWGGLMWLLWTEVLHDKPFGSVGAFDVFWLSVFLIGFPLAHVGHYAGLRYRLSRTRWRGIRFALGGSAWRYGGLATGLTLVNAFSAQLLTPVVSVNLARPRIGQARFGTLPFAFAGSAGDIYGRFVGYYFLNLLAWGIALAVVFAGIGGTLEGLRASGEDLEALLTRPGLRTVGLLLAAAVAAYLVFSLLILPLRCWWQAYWLRYLVSHSRAGDVLFATSITTRQMWGFLVLNYLIVVVSLGLGWPWVMHRTMRLIAGELWLYGAPDGAQIGQPAARGPRFGEGLLDMFDVTGV